MGSMIPKRCALSCPLWRFLLLLFFLLPACAYSGAKTSRNTQKLRIVSWNVQNLFDLQWQGTEYPEFDPRPRKSEEFKESGAAAKWTAELLNYRLKKLSAIVEQLDADIYALIEVESEAVLEQLNAELANPFPYFLLLRQRDQSVNMGLLSRLPIVRSARHEVGFLASGRSLRAIVEIVLELPRREKKDPADTSPPEQLIVLLNHWKSQRGGVAKTAAARRKAAALLSQRGKELQQLQKRANEDSAQNYIIALGDFNEPIDSHWNDSHRNSSGRKENTQANTSSFLPWQAKEALYIRAEPFGNSAAESFDAWSNSWFSPWFIYACKQRLKQKSNKAELKDWRTWPENCLKMGKLPHDLGSYAFRGKWQTIDHIFLNSAFFREGNFWHFANFDVARFPALLKDSEDGQIPNSWRNNQGISDHLPIILELEGSFQG